MKPERIEQDAAKARVDPARAGPQGTPRTSNELGFCEEEGSVEGTLEAFQTIVDTVPFNPLEKRRY